MSEDDKTAQQVAIGQASPNLIGITDSVRMQ